MLTVQIEIYVNHVKQQGKHVKLVMTNLKNLVVLNVLMASILINSIQVNFSVELVQVIALLVLL